jgi:predicted ABC-type sugar transport system permease subunit
MFNALLYPTMTLLLGNSMGNRTGGDATMTNLASGEPADISDDRQRRQFRLLRVALAVIRLGPLLILIALVAAMTLLSPVFLTTGNANNVLSQTAAIAVLAIGQLLVILTRGIDLSVGATLALASVLGHSPAGHSAIPPGHAWIDRRPHQGHT